MNKAIEQFYKAFNSKDMKLMQDNWLASEDIIMNNPLGGIKTGWSEISEVYKRIFLDKVDIQLEFYDYHIHDMDGGFYVVGRERGKISLGDKSLDLKIRTSRIFKLVEDEYKQVHHHGSIENPQLLEQYQNLLK